MARLQVFLFTVNDAGNREAITAATRCRKVTIIEQNLGASWPTTEYEVGDVISGGVAQRIMAGQAKVFLPSQRENMQMWEPGEIIGYAATITGSVPFYRIEEW